MSRILLAIALVFLVTLSIGWTLNVHFCMNRVEQISLFASEEHHCSFCGMQQEESNGCCHQEKQLVKLIQDQCPPHFIKYGIAPPAFYVWPVAPMPIVPLFVRAYTVKGSIHHPPDGSPPPLFIQHGVFRI
jgi:hypothetical protein